MKNIIDLIYPRRCPVCDGIVTGTRLICRDCAKRAEFQTEPCCLTCGRSLRPTEIAKGTEYCDVCNGVTHDFDFAMPVFSYRSMADSISRFKYRGRCEYAEFYASAAIRRYGELLGKLHIQAIVPVPLHPARKRRRGYNQATAFARALSKKTGVPLRADLLVRVKNTPPLKGLDPANRRIRVKNAFNIRKNDVKLKRILIVDDIYTTGATVDEIAALLKRCGVTKVYVLTVAA